MSPHVTNALRVAAASPVPSRRPKLLFLSHRLPYPPHNGAALRTLNILRALSRHFEIHALCFDRLDDASRGMSVQTRLDALAELGSFEWFPIAQQQSRLRLLRDHILSLLSGRSYVHFVHDSRVFELRLLTLLTENDFSLVHIDSLDLARVLPKVAKLPTVLTHHNVESALLARRARAEKSFFRRWYITHQARLMRNEEMRALPVVDLNVAVSSEDAADLRKMTGNAKVVVVPNGVDIDYFAPASQEEAVQGCIFVGGTNYFPNRDALDWFSSEVAPELRRLDARIDVTWVGRATEREMRQFDGSNGIRLTGYVDDIRPYFNQAACFIAPLRVGGGTRLKLVDAWAMGKAIISTSLGCEGLAAKDGVNMLIRDDAKSFAAAIVEVCANASLRRGLEREARMTAMTQYAWNVLEPAMISEYMRLTKPLGLTGSDEEIVDPDRLAHG